MIKKTILSEDSQLKRKAKKILLGLGITSIVGGGYLYKHKMSNEEGPYFSNREQTITKTANNTDEENTVFIDTQKKQTLDSLHYQCEQIGAKIDKLDKARKNLEDEFNAQLYATALKKDAKKYIALRDKMLENKVYIDYEKEDKSGVSLNDLLTANANSDNALWIAINRKRGNCDKRLGFSADYQAGRFKIDILEKNAKGEFEVIGSRSIMEQSYPIESKDKEKVDLKVFLRQEPASTVQGIDKQLAVLAGFGYYMRIEIDNIKKSTDSVSEEKNGGVDKIENLPKAAYSANLFRGR